MKTIKQTYLINAPVSEVWKALTNTKYIDGWGGGPSKMDENVGTDFSFWDGEIWGKNLEVEPNKKLVQHWYSKGELPSDPSTVTFNLSDKDGSTALEMVQTDVPDEFEKQLDDGWRDFYLNPLKKYLEK